VPEYLAPGVYVEETSFRAKSIEGVGTSTTGFVGLALKGPIGTTSFITSFGDFQRIYGGFYNLNLTGLDSTELSAAKDVNYLAHSVQAFFNNGGSRLYVSRVYGGDATVTAASKELATSPAGTDAQVHFQARFPGFAGNGHINLRLIGTLVNAFIDKPDKSRVFNPAILNGLPPGTMLRVPGTAPAADTFYVKNADDSFQHLPDNVTTKTNDLKIDPNAKLTVLTFTVTATGNPHDPPMVYDNLGFTSNHPRWAGAVLSPNPKRLADAQENMFALFIGAKVTPDQLLAALFPNLAAGTTDLDLTGGTDGGEPSSTDFANALKALESVEEIAIVAAPGSSIFDQSDAIIQELLIHVQKPRAYRVAILEASPAVTGKDVQVTRSKIDSTYAAFYYPWIDVANPLARPEVHNIPQEILLPPSGFMAGIYARTDELYGVFKSPANEVVLGALRFETDINFATQGILNPLGINCLRFFAGRGYRVWGARTASSDPEWKYVNVRRYFIYLEHSIDNSTQWAVFENNGPALWDNIRQTVESFLYAEWKNGALLGSKPEEAYFVRCDRTTMTQNDLDNGRMVCLIGVAVLKPAEFVIFRIGQKTADAKS
jgi:phage tail sheath protein FI